MKHQWVTGEIPTEDPSPLDALFGFSKPPDPENGTAAPSADRDGGTGDFEAGKLQRGHYHKSGSQQRKSPLDRVLTITGFGDVRATAKTERRVTLRKLASLIRTTTAPEKSRLPWLKLAGFGEAKTKKGSLRHDANVLRIDGIEGDHDAGTMTVDEACARLREAGLGGVVYTSPSHTPENPRWRVLCVTSGSLPPEERARLAARVNGVLDGALSGESFTLSQSFYFGSVASNPDHRVELVEGRYLDAAADLDATALGRGERREGGEPKAVRDDSGSGALFRLAGRIKLSGGTREDFEEAIADDPEAARHVAEQRSPERAMERAWERNPDPPDYAASFDDDPDYLKLIGRPPKVKRKGSEALNFVCAADAQPEPVEWVWPGRLARGKITLVAGDPGMGKSQISGDVAARITTGAPWPDGGRAPWGTVLILSAEDAVNDTMVPRLMAARADRARVHILQSVTGEKGVRRSFSLQADLAALGSKVEELGDVALVIIDPITSYMGSIDSHRTTDVRAVLEPVAEWAGRLNVAVLAITHPPKAAQGKAINAFTGSLAYVAAARAAFLAIAEPDTGRSLLLLVKTNLGLKPAGLGYKITGQTVGDGIETSRIEWDGEAVTVTADEALSADRESGKKSSRPVNDAENFLRNALGFGAQPADGVKADAEEMGITPMTLKRAKASLGVVSRKADFGGGWLWELP